MKIGDIIHIKLNSGDELVAEVVENDKLVLVLKHIVMIEKIMSGDGSTYYIMRNWMTKVEDENVFLDKRHVIAKVVPHKEVVNQYHNTVTMIIDKSNMETTTMNYQDLEDMLDSEEDLMFGSTLNSKYMN